MHLEMLEQILQQQLAHVTGELESEAGILRSSAGTTRSARMPTAVGAMCSPPMPLRFGSMNLIVSFHIADV